MEDKLNIKNSASDICAKTVEKTYFFAHLSKKIEDDIIYIQVSLTVRDENTLKRELKPLESIQDYYKKYIITLDYDTNNYNGIKQISAMDFLLDRVEL